MIFRDSVLRMVLRLLVLFANAGVFAFAARRLSAFDMGVWAMVSAMTPVVMSFDLGLANHIRNKLVCNSRVAQRYFYSGLVLATLVAAAVAAGADLFFWSARGFGVQVGGADFSASIEFLMLVVLLLVVRFPCAIAISSFFSFNEANTFNFCEFLSVSLGAGAASLALWLGLGVKWGLIGFYGFGSLVCICGLILFISRRDWWRGARIEFPNFGILKTALPFGVLQLISLVLNGLPPLVVGAFVGVEQVTAVRATMVVCQTIVSLHLAHAMPIWTEVTSLHLSDNPKDSCAFLSRRLIQESIGLGFVFFFLMFVTPMLANIWLGKEIVELKLSALFCVWAFGVSLCNLHSLVLNGRDKPLKTALALAPGSIFSLFSAGLFSDHFGSNGVGASFAIGALMSALMMIIFARKELRSSVYPGR